VQWGDDFNSVEEISFPVGDPESSNINVTVVAEICDSQGENCAERDDQGFNAAYRLSCYPPGNVAAEVIAGAYYCFSTARDTLCPIMDDDDVNVCGICRLCRRNTDSYAHSSDPRTVWHRRGEVPVAGQAVQQRGCEIPVSSFIASASLAIADSSILPNADYCNKECLLLTVVADAGFLQWRKLETRHYQPWWKSSKMC